MKAGVVCGAGGCNGVNGYPGNGPYTALCADDIMLLVFIACSGEYNPVCLTLVSEFDLSAIFEGLSGERGLDSSCLRFFVSRFRVFPIDFVHLNNHSLH